MAKLKISQLNQIEEDQNPPKKPSRIGSCKSNKY